MGTSHTPWSDREMLNDLLFSEGSLTEQYNLASNEATTPLLQNELIHLLVEAHQTVTETVNELSKRGWYLSEEASKEAIKKEKQKFLEHLHP